MINGFDEEFGFMSDRKPTKIQSVKDVIEAVSWISQNKYNSEMAHIAEDQLHLEVLEQAENQTSLEEYSAMCWLTAQTKNIDFSRWYS
ncbi:hypothetical protein [Companilactobacillus mishanensis]|uniref:Uncharacterized protein n=1 Tax=Companilactobacillus mishanensis TaxID=2486008 RepID=A0A5P0ZGF9_9LACO|nr:hypothetical protein [Companilactobacillus mishanensis]MQS52140.1 hypothetical protein [Companilactobacillus mishanensis]